MRLLTLAAHGLRLLSSRLFTGAGGDVPSIGIGFARLDVPEFDEAVSRLARARADRAD